MTPTVVQSVTTERARALGLDIVLTAGGDAGLLAGLLAWAQARTHC